jgi:hypothetical protein
MSGKRIFVVTLFSFFLILSVFGQENENQEGRILFHGIVKDAKTFFPISNSQIIINRVFTTVSSGDGTFSLFVNRNDSVIFRHLGYKPTLMYISDTLAGKDFIAGIYMNSDTLSIGEVVIVPRFINLKSAIMNAPSKVPSRMDNARYNVAISAYQGRISQGKLGDPSANYNMIRQRETVNAIEKGGIPSDRIVGISPLLLVPAAYLLIHGVPEKPAPIEKKLSDAELDLIQIKYYESIKHRK